MTVAKVLPIRKVRYFDNLRGVYSLNHPRATEFEDVGGIKDFIVKTLFSEGTTTVDYLLIAWDSKLFVVERDGVNKYCKREIHYHPLMDKVKISDKA